MDNNKILVTLTLALLLHDRKKKKSDKCVPYQSCFFISLKISIGGFNFKMYFSLR